MKPYVPPLEGRRDCLRLDFNENTVGFPAELPEHEANLLTTYPEYEALIDALAEHLQLPSEQILLTNGSDEGLFVTAFTYIRPNEDRAVISTPSFSLLEHYLALCQAQIVQVPVTDELRFDLDGLEKSFDGARLVMLCSPENPTGDVIGNEHLERWLKTYPDTVFVIDEAYGEYSQGSALGLLKDNPNLVICRTFSKAWGLAGLRLGLVLAHPQVIGWLSIVRSPYSVNSVAVKTLLEFLPQADRVTEQAAAVLKNKAETIAQMRRRGYKVTNGAANFFLVWVGEDAQIFCDFLKSEGILIRNRSHMTKMKGVVRISAGSKEQMERLLRAVDDFRQTHAVIFDMDDTLVDTSKSFDQTIVDLVEEFGGGSVEHSDIQELRATGGFNDDWDTTHELLKRRGVEVGLAEITKRGQEIYLALAPEAETLLVDLDWLGRLATRYRVFVYTGRMREEYEPVWAERLGSLFEEVLCKGDVAGVSPKPSPDGLVYLRNQCELRHITYIGNSVDDMACAAAANCRAVGVTTNQAANVLENAGADHIFSSPNEVRTIWMLDAPQ
jgi:histidinol-phosphate aminotransferase